MWPVTRHAIYCLTLLCYAMPAVAKEQVDYNRDIRPILSENCFYCHGADNNYREADLRLDDRAAAIEAGVLVPGDADASDFIARIIAADDSIMPPADSNRHLTDDQKSLLKQWIDQGAKYQRHWAFESVQRPKVPAEDIATEANAWGKGSIDAFVLQRLGKEGLTPTAEAPPEQWLRRVSFDLIGLPPLPQEIDSFIAKVKEQGEAAYEAEVDRLLASPHYGERMAIDWLDVARYADTHGFNNDASRSMWRWRDWVIESFNRNQPYNDFITEQLAGDLLPNPTLDQIIATGFNRNHVINSEGGIIEEEYRVEYVADRVRTVSMAWLGLTMECTRCHDHKYDPFSQRDFYQLFAFFNNVEEWGEDGRVANAPPMIQAPTRDQQKKIYAYGELIRQLRAELEPARHEWEYNKSMASDLRQCAEEAALCLPKDQAFTLAFDSPAEPLNDAAISFPQPNDEISIPERQLRYSQGTPMSFSLWLCQEEGSPGDAPLISTIDYSLDPSSQRYGKGLEIRLIDGEIEYCLSRRFPAYSITVRTRGANIDPNQWRHVAVVYQGSADQQQEQRCKAEWVRIWIDGELADVDILHDDLQYGSPNGSTLVRRPFRIGHSTNPKANQFHGQLAKISAYRKAIASKEVRSLFAIGALPHALDQQAAEIPTPREQKWLRDAYLETTDREWGARRGEIRRKKEAQLAIHLSSPSTMVMQEMQAPRQAFVLERGLYDSLGDPVEPGVLDTLLPMPTGAPANRLGLAQWLTDPQHPLTARVVVNRFWQQLFGVGLVKTSEDFGYQGEWPSHPELLDWLAAEFVQSDWDVKRLLKHIVLSSTYRQDSNGNVNLMANDPENRSLARGARFRLPAELIRDQALYSSGLLVRSVGGPSVRPYQPEGLYKGMVVGSNYPGTTWQDSTGDGLYRRSLYTFWKRTAPHPALVGFDAPDREVCTVRRSATNTPLQALHLMNGPLYIEASRKLAERVIKENTNTNRDDRLEALFRLGTGRRPTAKEITHLASLFDQMQSEFTNDPKAAEKLLSIGNSSVSKTIDSAELAAWTMVSSVVLNLDETITRN